MEYTEISVTRHISKACIGSDSGLRIFLSVELVAT